MTWRQIAGAGILCGVGFTTSFFTANIAFPDAASLALVKVSVILASIAAGTVGWIGLRGFAPAPKH